MSQVSSQSDIDVYYNHVYKLVEQAGEVFREGWFGLKNVEVKLAHYDQVTQYDGKIEAILMKGISERFPDHKFIGEETSAHNKCIPKLTDAPTWIIDPIDGTANFIKLIPHSCISIGLTINKELRIGIVYNPIANEMYTAKRGQGAFLNGKPIHASTEEKYSNAILGLEISLIHAPKVRDKYMKRLYHLGSPATGTRSFGSASLSLCYVASGILDCYHIEDLKPWDMAAGVLLIREAGGVVYHTSGKEFDIMNPDLVCAGTESICQQMIKLIENANQTTDIQFP